MPVKEKDLIANGLSEVQANTVLREFRYNPNPKNLTVQEIIAILNRTSSSYYLTADQWERIFKIQWGKIKMFFTPGENTTEGVATYRAAIYIKEIRRNIASMQAEERMPLAELRQYYETRIIKKSFYRRDHLKRPRLVGPDITVPIEDIAYFVKRRENMAKCIPFALPKEVWECLVPGVTPYLKPSTTVGWEEEFCCSVDIAVVRKLVDGTK